MSYGLKQRSIDDGIERLIELVNQSLSNLSAHLKVNPNLKKAEYTHIHGHTLITI